MRSLLSGYISQGVKWDLSPIREDSVVRIITLEDHFATPMFQERFPQGNVPGHFLADRGRYLGYDISSELLNLGDSRLAAMDAAGIALQDSLLCRRLTPPRQRKSWNEPLRSSASRAP